MAGRSPAISVTWSSRSRRPSASRPPRSYLRARDRPPGIHGALQLAGYDHENDEGQMERLERRLRRELLK